MFHDLWIFVTISVTLSCGADLASQKVVTVPVVIYVLHRACNQAPKPFTYRTLHPTAKYSARPPLL